MEYKQNNLYSKEYSDEYYTDLETVKLCINQLNIEKGKTVLCPFDSDKSLFVQELKKTNKVLYGMRDFLEEGIYYECDYIITNPPFSIKDKVIEKSIEYNKPTLLILPIDTLGGVKRHKLYTKTKLKIYVPTKRINYYDVLKGRNKNGVNFHSIFLILNSSNKNEIRFEFEN